MLEISHMHPLTIYPPWAENRLISARKSGLKRITVRSAVGGRTGGWLPPTRERGAWHCLATGGRSMFSSGGGAPLSPG